MFVVYCIVLVPCIVNLRMANRSVIYNLSGTVLVSVVVLFFLRENRPYFDLHTLVPVPVPDWSLLTCMAPGGCLASHLSTRDAGWNLHRGGFFLFSDCVSGSGPSFRSGSEPRTGSKPDPDGGKGWIKTWIRTQVNPDPHPGFFFLPDPHHKVLPHGSIWFVVFYVIKIFIDHF